jgi:hypothetical protein
MFDFASRTFTGVPDEQPVAANVLRLPDAQSLWSEEFDSLEVWNGFQTADTDGDGVRELEKLDLVMRDWMNFLSFGKLVSPVGNSDTHSRDKDPAGMPRSMVRVSDDSAAALAGGLDEDIYGTLLGTTQMDVVVTDGPMLAVSADGGATSAIGAVVDAAGGSVTLTIRATSADWVAIDTIEVFANSTFDPVGDSTALQPVACFTSRDPGTIAANDPCSLAPAGGAQAMTVALVDVGGPPATGFTRHEAEVTLTLAMADIPRRDGTMGDDAWIVVRVRGQRAIWPVLAEDIVLDEADLDTLVMGSAAEIDTLLRSRGVFATAFTAPVLVDFDGGGFRAPFAP